MLAGHRGRLAEVFPNPTTSPIRGDRRRKVRHGRIGALQPPADGQRHLLGVRRLLVIGVLHESRHAIQRIGPDLGGHLFQNRLEVLASDGVRHPLADRIEVLDDVLSPRVVRIVFLDHLPNALENLAAHVLGGKFRQQLPHQPVLAGVTTQFQLREQPLRRKLRDRANRRRQLLFQIGPIGIGLQQPSNTCRASS